MAHVRVRLETAQVQLVFEGDEGVFDRCIEPLLRRLGGGRPRAESEVAAQATGPEPEEAPEVSAAPEPVVSGWRPAATSFRTFRLQLAADPAGTDEQITAYAFYLWNYEKLETFGLDELGGCFAAGGESIPDTLSDTCGDLERRRILLPAAHEGTWRLTPKGTSLVRKLLR